ncbi:hypothetical protein [Streptomyces sp. NPDC001985]|uniref:hypothetical protein n=1 Tax=Streptomyces sp. NPDC001985 TaxID=3154406 RepID=UPI00331CC30B
MEPDPGRAQRTGARALATTTAEPYGTTAGGPSLRPTLSPAAPVEKAVARSPGGGTSSPSDPAPRGSRGAASPAAASSSVRSPAGTTSPAAAPTSTAPTRTPAPTPTRTPRPTSAAPTGTTPSPTPTPTPTPSPPVRVKQVTVTDLSQTDRASGATATVEVATDGTGPITLVVTWYTSEIRGELGTAERTQTFRRSGARFYTLTASHVFEGSGCYLGAGAATDPGAGSGAASRQVFDWRCASDE